MFSLLSMNTITPANPKSACFPIGGHNIAETLVTSTRGCHYGFALSYDVSRTLTRGKLPRTICRVSITACRLSMSSGHRLSLVRCLADYLDCLGCLPNRLASPPITTYRLKFEIVSVSDVNAPSRLPEQLEHSCETDRGSI